MRGFQRRYLRSLGHKLEPVVLIGRNGLSDALIEKAKRELAAHELIKVRFLDFKEQRRELTETLAAATGSEVAGVLGNTALLYRPSDEPGERRIRLPERAPEKRQSDPGT